MDNRNYLARLRTQMANERTLMSYYRGALALVGLGAFIFKFYDSIFFIVLSGISVLTGVILSIYGTVRYRKYKQKLLKRTV
ncbi:DUF202 domain-containing protein [Fulvivirga sedimenti]|uniref:DUF202 domain-containing protein n=1 Tax=Fulvivirga sedimenti TaxID=2879465 RepID=A0A9X1HJX3_9BACT|nr:DUF202 domain-containing protein [Fulvivirga sedimenti]MCA6073455.1 DUF202 domain-containing protein [Fulvivirga sedimenti]